MTKNEFIQRMMVSLSRNRIYTNVEGIEMGRIMYDAERMARVAEDHFDENFFDKDDTV